MIGGFIKSFFQFIFQNVGKALRSTWKCLMLGLYSFALGYSTPITVAATFVPDFHPSRNRTWFELCRSPPLCFHTIYTSNSQTLTKDFKNVNNDCAIQITFSNSLLLQILQDLLHGHICRNMQDHKILLSIRLTTENTCF